MGIKIGNTDISAIKIGSTRRLPAEYQEVEYIESSGTQCIDTGLTVSGNVKIDFEYMPLESSATSPIFMDDDWRVNGFGSGNTYLYYGGYTSNNEGVSVGSLVQNVKAHDIVAKDGSSRNEGITWIPSSSYPSPTGNLKIFVGQRAGNITSYTQTRLYSYKRYDNDILTQDLVPCYRRNDTEIGLYDLVNDVFYPNTGGGSFTKGGDSLQYKDIQKVYLGSTLIRPTFKDLYQEVEYIQTTGTQWINTGIFASNSIQTETKVEVTTTNMNKPVFGGCGGNSGYTASKQYHLTPYNYKWYYGLNNSEGNAGTYNNTVGTQYTLIYNNANNKISVNGSEIGNTTGTVGVPNSSLAISYRGSPGNTLYYGQFKYFYFKIYDKSTGTYVRNMIPCYRKADSVIGMYDLINNTFYTNSGTGTFTKGPDV